MRSKHPLRTLVALLLLCSSLSLVPSTSSARTGSVIGEVAGDLSQAFGRAVTPTPPLRKLEPKLDYTPPEYVPVPAPGGSGGFGGWSTGQVPGSFPPFERLKDIFNRVARPPN